MKRREKIPFKSPTRRSVASRISTMTSAAGGFPRIENQSPASHRQYMVMTESKMVLPSNKFKNKFGWNDSKRKILRWPSMKTLSYRLSCHLIQVWQFMKFPNPKEIILPFGCWGGPWGRITSFMSFSMSISIMFGCNHCHVSKYVDPKPCRNDKFIPL